MVRLTPELIEDSYQYMNPIREYELSLRGYKIGLIENLGATLNQFDTIDFTDNDVRRLDGFPLLSKLKNLLFSNNKIQFVAPNLETYLPSLESLVLTNNNIEELTEIENLASIKTLKILCLLRNPVASLKHYRLYTIYRLPNLRILDFKKIKEKERQDAQKLFKGKKLKQSDKPKTFVPGELLDKVNFSYPNNASAGFGHEQQFQRVERVQPSKEDIEAIRYAISQAKSIDEIERLNAMLRSGIIPTNFKQQAIAKKAGQDNHGQIVEEEDDVNSYHNYNQQHQQQHQYHHHQHHQQRYGSHMDQS